MSEDLIFVYGTLRKNNVTPMSHVFAGHCEYLEDAHMQGLLFEVDGYPGAVSSENPGDMVYGELYRITNPSTLLPLLDEYEGCTENFSEPQEYIRKKQVIFLDNGGAVLAWVYIFNGDVSRLRQIISGDYLNNYD